MPEKMFKVTATAKMRKHNTQLFDAYWCAGKRWESLTQTTHVLTALQFEALQKEETDGYPIHLVGFEEITEKAPEPLPVAAVPPVTKQPWEK